MRLPLLILTWSAAVFAVVFVLLFVAMVATGFLLGLSGGVTR